ncbi:helix-turn-helix domain-containing protein [Roseibium aggregatum]|uniref:Addiction module antidote protein, HigA family n=1 Tax=Roseibium aggregatum TaxID=187304 RepID=A0A0M6Y6E6_9HYPH|nr:helix-turn-helix domain-containing protein [Roseibium aggregatum]CTQ45676.1 addiction module antidote protein, HigA family [Roseibium aggregatum]
MSNEESKFPIPNIKALRDERNMSLSELAKLIDRSRMAINRIERGERKLTMEWAEAFAQALNVPVGKIFGDSGSFAPISADWLETEMSRKGLLRKELAELLGIAPSAVTNILQGKRRISGEEAEKINNWLRSSADRGSASIAARSANVPLKSLRKEDGAYRFAGKASGTIPALPAQADDKGAYAVTQVGFDMAPKFEQGDTLYVVTERQPRIGDYVVATFANKNILIRRLTEADANGYTLATVSDGSAEKFSGNEIEKLDLIVGSTSV